MIADIVTLAGPPRDQDMLTASVLHKDGDYLAFISSDDRTLLYIGFRTNTVIVSTQGQSGAWRQLEEREIRVAEASLSVVFHASTVIVSMNSRKIYSGVIEIDRIWRVIADGEWENCKFEINNAESYSANVVKRVEGICQKNDICDDLIFDIGMHRGDDTDYYLQKGFRVLAVEANPNLCSAASRRFARFIEENKLIILNVGVGLERSTLPFYINIDNSEWSSFNHSIAIRHKFSRGRCETIDVQVYSITELFNAYGVPRYAKIDIEGYDGYVVKGISEFPQKPSFVSYENAGIESFELLAAAGYESFQMVNQLEVQKVAQPGATREGRSVDWTFSPGASGLFGRDLPDSWCTATQMRERLEAYQVERIRGLDSGQSGWFDLHAAFGGALRVREA